MGGLGDRRTDQLSGGQAKRVALARTLVTDADLDALVDAIELPSAVGHARGQGLIQTIAAVREVYDGPLLYGANWDEQVAPEVWAALDMVGVQLYSPLSHAPDPDVRMMRAGLRPHLKRWADIARAANKPLVLTEVGYRASPTAASAPYAWPEHQEGAREVDEALQARAYHALFEEATAHEVRGIFLWKIFTDPHTDEEGLDGFSPRGKAAARHVRRCCSLSGFRTT